MTRYTADRVDDIENVVNADQKRALAVLREQGVLP